VSEGGGDDLRRKLAALARTDQMEPGGARVISRGGTPTPLQAILAEIDETILTRDLIFDFAGNGQLVLVVSGRRLLGVRRIDGLAMPAVAAQLAGQQIEGPDDPHLRALVGVLMPLDLLTDPVLITTLSAEWSGPETGTGVGVERLAEKLSVAYPFQPVTRMVQFRTLIEDNCVAVVQRLETGEEITEGPEDQLEWLFSSVPTFLSTVSPQEAMPKLASLGHHSDTNRMISVAFDGAEMLIWAHDPDLLGKFCVQWQSIFSD